MSESADEADSKSAARKSVWVQVPISAPETFERLVVNGASPPSEGAPSKLGGKTLVVQLSESLKEW